MKASVVCLLFASLLVIVLPRGNEGHKPKRNVEQEEVGPFNIFDADNNGYISLNEIRITLSEFGSVENPELMMQLYDTNNDNQISFEEFEPYSSTNDEEDDN